jgi:hypothetical protein
MASQVLKSSVAARGVGRSYSYLITPSRDVSRADRVGLVTPVII